MGQNSSLQDDLSPFLPSDLEEVFSEATNSNDEISRTRDSASDLSLDEGTSDLDSELESVVSDETESEAGRLLAARIPPELFDNILFYVNVHCRSGTYLERKRGGRTSRDMHNNLTQCSLVCLFWANKCREHMFSERTLKINSYEDAEIFRRYVIGGCPRLTPVHQLISQIVVYQDYKSGRSFLHLLNLLNIQDKLNSLLINGPVPDGFHPAKLDTPHWSIPLCIVVPSSFLKKRIILENVHLPSFYHVTKYIRHFSCAAYMELTAITWDGSTPHLLPHASNAVAGRCRPRSLGISVNGVCTHPTHLAVTALMLNPNCPLHRLSDEERVWMIKFMTLLWGNEPNPNVRIAFDVSEQATTMDLYPFHFVFEEAPSTDRSASALRVVGVHAYIWSTSDDLPFAKLPANFDALVNHARTHPTIRALVVLSDSLDCLQNSVKPFVEVLALATETIELVLAYEKEEERQAVGVDLFTLKPSGAYSLLRSQFRADFALHRQPEGRIWADLPYEWQSQSLEVLRRELKKRR
ncbi:hypothetical protein BC629DRAFT_1599073 [Irpex lacteus]|nr:hypothetical protein BC629DRAFT_1599073 [Irpex lacteus]